jgi:hypothetical protein
MSELIKFPNRQEILTKKNLKPGMRVMLPDGQMHAKVVSANADCLSLHFDNTRNPVEYDWANIPDLVNEKI